MVQVRTSYCAAVMTCTAPGFRPQDFIIGPGAQHRHSLAQLHREVAERFAQLRGLGPFVDTVIDYTDTTRCGTPLDRIHSFNDL